MCFCGQNWKFSDLLMWFFFNSILKPFKPLGTCVYSYCLHGLLCEALCNFAEKVLKLWIELALLGDVADNIHSDISSILLLSSSLLLWCFQLLWKMLSSWWQLEEDDPICNSHPAGLNQSQTRLGWGAHPDSLSTAIRFLTHALGQPWLPPVWSHSITCCSLLSNWGRERQFYLYSSFHYRQTHCSLHLSPYNNKWHEINK